MRTLGEADLFEHPRGTALEIVDTRGRELCLDVLERGERRDEVELLEDEPERLEP